MMATLDGTNPPLQTVLSIILAGESLKNSLNSNPVLL